jgi:aminoacyl-tRNA hydrolase
MARQRHNIGFMAIERIADRHGFGPWRKRFHGLTAEGQLGGERILALKPMTYMNDSGDSVQAAAAFFKVPVESIAAFHDELDLVAGKLRVKKGGGAAGHNGLRSMDRMLGSPDYWRVRLGIGHPGSKERHARRRRRRRPYARRRQAGGFHDPRRPPGRHIKIGHNDFRSVGLDPRLRAPRPVSMV